MANIDLVLAGSLFFLSPKPKDRLYSSSQKSPKREKDIPFGITHEVDGLTYDSQTLGF